MSARYRVKSPVLLLVFKRPATTERVFARLREARPARLFIAADGPRNEAEAQLCLKTRQVAQRVDWDCKVETLFRAENLGLRHGISESLNWFFSKCEEGIILEDDCLPGPEFFRFCDELLARYKEEERVLLISGVNYQAGIKRGGGSYYFSKYAHIWGWATWRRAWEQYDVNMSGYPQSKKNRFLKKIFPTSFISRLWWNYLLSWTYRRRIASWAFPWSYTVFEKGLSIIPNANLVSNIGFDAGATNTFGSSTIFDKAATGTVYPLTHPPAVERDYGADLFFTRRWFWDCVKNYIVRKLRPFK